MQTQQLLKYAEELRQSIDRATKTVEKMQSEMPDIEEPALSAQCGVIRAFLYQTECQEVVFRDMLRARNAGSNSTT